MIKKQVKCSRDGLVVQSTYSTCVLECPRRANEGVELLGAAFEVFVSHTP